jgi:predicted transcriptional regulator
MVANVGIKNEANKQHQSESITFRLDSNILNKLHHEAEQKDISMNTLVSHIMRRHIDWHSNAVKAGFVTVRRGLLSNLINRLQKKRYVPLQKI